MMAFAVVDFETTGILPSYHHRVVEIGVTHVDDDGTITGRWETLINPERDLGPQHIHGIRAADILDAYLAMATATAARAAKRRLLSAEAYLGVQAALTADDAGPSGTATGA